MRQHQRGDEQQPLADQESTVAPDGTLRDLSAEATHEPSVLSGDTLLPRTAMKHIVALNVEREDARGQRIIVIFVDHQARRVFRENIHRITVGAQPGDIGLRNRIYQIYRPIPTAENVAEFGDAARVQAPVEILVRDPD